MSFSIATCFVLGSLSNGVVPVIAGCLGLRKPYGTTSPSPGFTGASELFMLASVEVLWTVRVDVLVSTKKRKQPALTLAQNLADTGRGGPAPLPGRNSGYAELSLSVHGVYST